MPGFEEWRLPISVMSSPDVSSVEFLLLPLFPEFLEFFLSTLEFIWKLSLLDLESLFSISDWYNYDL
jgi:hypothetical protein